MNKSRMTNAERRMYFRHKRKLYRIEQRAAKRKNKVSGQFMNRVVICMILAAFIYTVVAIIVFVRVGAEPSTLTENVFRFLSVEGGAMALIKSVKTVTQKDPGKQHENEPDDINADNNEVTKAEKELGAGTGKLKLRYVYDMFVARFEWLAKVITFDMFSMMVDEALEQMRTMLDSNEAVQKLIANEAGEGSE